MLAGSGYGCCRSVGDYRVVAARVCAEPHSTFHPLQRELCVAASMSLSSATFSGRQGLALAHPRALPPLRTPSTRVVCQAGKSPNGSNSERLREIIAVPAVAAIAAALMAGAVVPEAAWAARSGGRMGGSSFRAPRMAPGGGGGGYDFTSRYSSQTSICRNSNQGNCKATCATLQRK